MGRTEGLEISIADLRANSMLTQLILEEFPHFSDVDDNPPEPPSDRRTVLALSKEISTGIVDATNLLVMDMDYAFGAVLFHGIIRFMVIPDSTTWYSH
jgi:hypothetical protein